MVFFVSRTGLLVVLGTVGVAVGFAVTGPSRLVGVVGFGLVVIGLVRRGNSAVVDAARTSADVGVVRAEADRLRVETDRLRADLDTIREAAFDDRRRLERVSGGAAALRRRDLDEEAVAALLEYWNPRLGTECTAAVAAATLQRTRAVEDLAVGRLATTAADLLVRLLVAEAAPGERVEVCEIGTLFGVGALLIYDHLVGRARSVSLTLVDPLSGYYGEDRLDPNTGLAVSRRNLERNARLLGVDAPDLRIVERLSTDPAARAEVDDRRYGLLVIDGDHSWDGIRRDHEDYASLVAPGGFLVVDDYRAPEWPDVTRYTDEVIARDSRFCTVGALSRTAVFVRNEDERS